MTKENSKKESGEEESVMNSSSNDSNSKKNSNRVRTLVGTLAVIANLLLAVGKILVGYMSKSAAIIADGVNSGTDVIASSIGFIGIKVAEKPADEGHPYGHERAEVISGFVITLIIFASGLWIIYDAIKGFFTEEDIVLGILAFSVMATSAFINAIMSQLKIHFGKKHDSVSLVSDGVHSRIDLLVSIGIFLGLFLIKYYPQADSVIALLVGAFILKEAFSLGKETTDSLIGASASKEIEDKIKEVVNKKTGNIELKELKTQKIGDKVFAELTVKLPSKFKVEDSSKATQNLKNELIENIPKLEYTAIKVESSDVTYGFHKSALGLGRGLGWQRQGKFKSSGLRKGGTEDKKITEEAKGQGPGGNCICTNSKCKHKIEHKRGQPCSSIKCPKCGSPMKRE